MCRRRLWVRARVGTYEEGGGGDAEADGDGGDHGWRSGDRGGTLDASYRGN